MNTQQRAVVQQALEALEFCQAPIFRPDRGKREEAITALRQLLEQPERADHIRDATKMVSAGNKMAAIINTAITAPVDEWPTTDELDAAIKDWKEAVATTEDSSEVGHGDELTIAYLYGFHTGKKKAKREWVGLTNYEIGVCSTEAAMNRSEIVGGATTFARAIEAKLREKNGGTP